MYIYNVTIKVNYAIEENWLTWMQSEHMDEVLSTKLFYGCQLLTLVDAGDEEGNTYIAQYFTEKKENYERYVNEFAPLLREKGFQLFGDQFIAFRSVLKQIHSK